MSKMPKVKAFCLSMADRMEGLDRLRMIRYRTLELSYKEPHNTIPAQLIFQSLI